MTATKKRSVIVVSLIVLVILIGLFVAFRTQDIHFQSPVVFLPNPERVINRDKAHSVEESGAILEAPQAYSNKVMVFDNNCVASPITLTGKRGDSVMFDNHSNYQRTITVGDQSYSVDPFGHLVLSFGVIDTYQVSCDSFKDVGLIGIQ